MQPVTVFVPKGLGPYEMPLRDKNRKGCQQDI